MENINKDNLMSQAQNIWTMLDDMAESDPSAYRKFIDKQLTDGKEYMRLPDPHMCVKTTYVDVSSRESGTLYINLCEWARVPKPPDDESPIPVIGGVMGKLEENGETSKLVSLGFNPKILEDYGIDAKNHDEQQSLINLAIDFSKDHYKLTIPYTYALLPKSTKHKGTLKMVRDGLKVKVHKEDEAHEQQMKELSETFAPLSNKGGDSLISQLSNVSINTQSPPSSSGSESLIPNISLSGDSKKSASKKNLIQEISSVEGEGSKKPSFSMTLKDAEGDKQRRLVVKIDLPRVSSVKECVLDVDQKKLSLSVPDKYDNLELTFTEAVHCDESSAKFSKKSSTLTVIVPTVQT